MRIQKYLAECGVCSRRAAEELVREGKVIVNNKPATIGLIIDPENDRITCNGKRIRQKSCDKQYFMFYKPRGVITSMKAEDETDERSIVADLIKGIKGRVFPVGRLDRDSEGFLLLTDDGDLSQRLSHPRHHIPKTYRVTISKQVSIEKLDQIRKGISFDDGTTTLPAEVHIHSQTDNKTVLHISLFEGKNRQIRRMCEELGLEILLLKRIAIGDVLLGHMQPGEYRPLTHAEITRIFEAVDLKAPTFKKLSEKTIEVQNKIRKKNNLNKTSNERRLERQLRKMTKENKK